MDEGDRIGFNLVFTGSSAALAAMLGDPSAAFAAAGISYFVQEMTARRKRNVEELVTEATAIAGISGEELLDWACASPRNAAYLIEAIEAAWETMDEAKVRTLSYVIADGFKDEAKLDLGQLIVQTVRRFEAGHVSVLAEIEKRTSFRQWSNTEISIEELQSLFSRFGSGLLPIIGALESSRCIYQSTIGAGTAYAATGFGLDCLNYVKQGRWA